MIEIDQQLIVEKGSLTRAAQSSNKQSNQAIQNDSTNIESNIENTQPPTIIILDLYEDDSDEEENDFEQELTNEIEQIDKGNHIEGEYADLTEYKSLLHQLKKTKQKYSDPSTEFAKFYHASQFTRITEVVKGQLNFFCNPNGANVFASDGITVQFEDVIPVKEKNKIFFPVMYYLASFCPEQLKQIFITKQVNKYGIYAFAMLNHFTLGTSKVFTQIVDDFVPITPNVKSSKNNSICFLLLQKAIAKTKHGYDFLDKIYYVNVMKTFFNYALIVIEDFDDEIIEQIKTEISSKSLILMHSELNYMYFKPIQILDVLETQNPFGETITLFKLKSAYGRNIERGEWGFQSPLWTDDKKKELNVSQEDDGIFYIDFLSFIQNYCCIYSFRVSQNVKISQAFILRPTQASYFQLVLEQDDSLAFFIEFENENQIGYRKLSFFQVAIADAKSLNLMYCLKFYHFLQFTAQLKKGTYIIYLKRIKFTKNEVAEAILKIYGFHKTSFEQIQKIDNYKQSVFNEQINKKGKVAQENKFFKALTLDLRPKGWFVYKFINISQQAIEVKFKCDYKFNIICKPYSNNQAYKKLGKNEEMLIILKPLLKTKYTTDIQVNGEKYSF